MAILESLQLMDLPTEILYHIAEVLDPSTLKELRLTNRLLSDVSANTLFRTITILLWKRHSDLEKLTNELTDEGLKNGVFRYTKLLKLEVPYVKDVVDKVENFTKDVLPLMVEAMGRMEKLDVVYNVNSSTGADPDALHDQHAFRDYLQNGWGPAVPGFVDAICALPGMKKSLRLEELDGESIKPILSPIRGLHSLKLGGFIIADRVGSIDHDIANVLINNPDLLRLNIFVSMPVDFEEVLSLVSATVLEHLEMWCGYSAYTPKNLSKLNKLRTLKLGGLLSLEYGKPEDDSAYNSWNSMTKVGIRLEELEVVFIDPEVFRPYLQHCGGALTSLTLILLHDLKMFWWGDSGNLENISEFFWEKVMPVVVDQLQLLKVSTWHAQSDPDDGAINHALEIADMFSITKWNKYIKPRPRPLKHLCLPLVFPEDEMDNDWYQHIADRTKAFFTGISRYLNDGIERIKVNAMFNYDADRNDFDWNLHCPKALLRWSIRDCTTEKMVGLIPGVRLEFSVLAPHVRGGNGHSLHTMHGTSHPPTVVLISEVDMLRQLEVTKTGA